MATLWPCLTTIRSVPDVWRKFRKLDCQICTGFTPAQIQQLATPTYKSRKERGEQKKMATETPSSATPTLVVPSDVRLLGWVNSDKPYSVESTPTGKKKKKRSHVSPKSSKRKPSSKPTSEDLKSLDDKWSGVRDFHD